MRYEQARKEMRQITEAVANQLRYDNKWANDDVRLFLTLLNNPETLFNQSNWQGVVLYRDGNLTIYAVLWEWVLVRKLKRLQMEGQVQRPEDWKDCIAITRLRGGGGDVCWLEYELSLRRTQSHSSRRVP